MILNSGNMTLTSEVGPESTLDVAYYESGGYIIILTHNGVSYGYRGMPKDWVAPADGEGVDPDQPSGDGLSIETAYTFKTYSTYRDSFGCPVMCLLGAENGAVFNIGSCVMTKFPTDFQYLNYGLWYTELCEYSINGVDQEVDFAKSCTWLEGNNVRGFTVKYIYIVTTDGNGIYYKYDGKMFL